MSDAKVIRFENLRQGSSVVGVAEVVQAQVRPFVANNAHGILCKVSGQEEVAVLAASAGKRTLAMISSAS
jgi:hypothetical protein